MLDLPCAYIDVNISDKTVLKKNNIIVFMLLIQLISEQDFLRFQNTQKRLSASNLKQTRNLH